MGPPGLVDAMYGKNLSKLMVRIRFGKTRIFLVYCTNFREEALSNSRRSYTEPPERLMSPCWTFMTSTAWGWASLEAALCASSTSVGTSRKPLVLCLPPVGALFSIVRDCTMHICCAKDNILYEFRTYCIFVCTHHGGSLRDVVYLGWPI